MMTRRRNRVRRMQTLLMINPTRQPGKRIMRISRPGCSHSKEVAGCNLRYVEVLNTGDPGF